MDELDALMDDLEELDSFDTDLAGAYDLEGLADKGLSELADELDEAGLEEFSVEAFGADDEDFDLAGLSDGEEPSADAAFVSGFIKRKVGKLLKKLIQLLKKYSKLRRCKKCVRLVTKAIRAYKHRKYVSALRYAYKASRCFKRCVK